MPADLPEPSAIADLVEDFVTDEYRQAAQYDNKDVLDDSGVYSLHLLAARIYAEGHAEGRRAAEARQRGERRRADHTNSRG